MAAARSSRLESVRQPSDNNLTPQARLWLGLAEAARGAYAAAIASLGVGGVIFASSDGRPDIACAVDGEALAPVPGAAAHSERRTAPVCLTGSTYEPGPSWSTVHFTAPSTRPRAKPPPGHKPSGDSHGQQRPRRG